MTSNPTPDRYRCAEEADAMQWTGSNAKELRAFCGSDFDTIDPEDRAEDPDETAVVRSHKHGGWLGLTDGDWVVKHADHFSVASDEEFRGRWSPATPPSVSAVDQTTRDRIAAAIWERQNPGRRWADCEYRWRADAEADAAAVLAVLPPPADRAAVLRAAADFAADFNSDCQNCAVELEVAAELRRLADEAQQPAVGARQPDTQTQVVEDPARIDRLRPEFFEHASVEAIDSQIRRARRQQGMWEHRVLKLTSLRQTRVTQKERGEWPAAASAVPGRSAATSTDEETRSAQDGAES